MSKNKKNKQKDTDKKSVSKFSKTEHLLSKLSSFERSLLLDEYCTSCGNKEEDCDCED